jgi:hypothetical protein
MPAPDRVQLARDAYRAYETSDRELIESLMSDDLIFYSPADPGIDVRATSSAAGRTPARSRPSRSSGSSRAARR